MTYGVRRKITESAAELLKISKFLQAIRDDLSSALLDEQDAFKECFEKSDDSSEQNRAIERLVDLGEAIDDLRRIDLEATALLLISIIE